MTKLNSIKLMNIVIGSVSPVHYSESSDVCEKFISLTAVFYCLYS